MNLQTTLLVLSILTSAVGLAAVLLRTGHGLGMLTARVQGLEREMTLRFQASDARVDARFDAVDARFDAVDDRLDGLDRRLERVETGLGSTQGALTGVRVDLARIGQKLDDHVLDPRAHRVSPG